MKRLYRILVVFATCFSFAVIVVGAYVRLMDAGLGCPDWPGCYGAMSPVQAERHIAEAVAAQGGEHGPVSLTKAWKEMFHRYLAGTLGLLIATIAIIGGLERAKLKQTATLPSVLLALVIVQAALGMWTVTLLLKPVIVTLHLLGGMATWALLVWLTMRQLSIGAPRDADAARRLRPWAAIALALLVVQIALGGWVSSNYAALACVDLPKCHGEWVPPMDFEHGFQLMRELGKTAAGAHLTYEALTAIHWTHRVGALVTSMYVGALAFVLMRLPGARAYGAALALALTIQVALGIANVLAGLPLAVALAHNGAAAVFLAVLVVLNFALSRVDLTCSRA